MATTSTRSKKQPLLSLSAQRMDEIDSRSKRPNKAASPSNRSSLSLITMRNEEEEPGRERKKGHKFFFVCCDTKRAVVWLNTLMLMINVATLTAAVMSDRARADGYTKAIIVRSCGMFVTFTAILGAYWYSKSIVLVGLAFTCYQLTVAICKVAKYNWDGGYNEDSQLDVLVPAIWYALVFYAEGAFINELIDGIMSAETYKRREKYSCCCNC